MHPILSPARPSIAVSGRADTDPPGELFHNPEAEHAAIGFLLDQPDQAWPLFDRHGVCRRWFCDERLSDILQLSTTLRAKNLPVDTISVLKSADQSRNKIDHLLLAGLAQSAATPASIEGYLGILSDLCQRRSVAEAATRLKNLTTDLDTPTAALVDGLESIAHQIRRSSNAGLEGELASRLFDPNRAPQPLNAIYSLAGQVIATPGNISLILAQAKTGKSAFIGAMLASTMTRAEIDSLGVTSANPDGRVVLHFDTEQSPEDHWHHIDRARRRAGVLKLPGSIRSYMLTGLAAPQAWQAVQTAVRMAADTGIHSILLDGVADLVVDPNDQKETNPFVSALHALAIEHDCPVVCVLHFNPGSEKARGHLGSQLERKAETNLRLDKDGETSVVWSDKQRRAPILKDTAPRFTWSDEAGMHVTIESARSARAERDHTEAAAEVLEVFSDGVPLPYTEVVDRVQKLLDLKRTSAKRRRDNWISMGLIRKTRAGYYERTT